MQQVLDQPELTRTTDERRLQTCRLERATPAGDDPERPPQRDGLALALELMGPTAFVRKGRLGRAPGGVVDEHRPRYGDGLHPRRSVDEVASDHALADNADIDRRLTCEHARSREELWRTDLLPECLDGLEDIQRRPHRAFRIILVRHWCPPHRHNGVTYELLYRAAVTLDP